MFGSGAVLAFGREGVGGDLKPWLRCPVATVQALAPSEDNSKRWQPPYRYFSFICGRNLGHISNSRFT